jgi:ParB family chromosome partitioning protein
MAKADDLLRTMGGAITESASHRGAPVAMPAALAGSTLTSDRLTGVVRSKTALEIPLDRIERDPAQPREEFDEEALRRLSDSIRSRGVLQPIRVRWDEGQGRYVIICGERRWRASQMAGVLTIPCVVADRPAEPGELLAIQLVENALREDLKPVEQARAYRTLMTVNNWSGNQLSKELGVSQSSVVQALALLELPASVQERVESGELPASTAYAIASLPDADAQAEVATRAVAEGLSRAEVVKAVRETSARSGKGRGAKPKPRKTTATLRSSNGAKVTIEHRRGVDDALIASVLKELLEQIEARGQSRGEAA